MTSHPEGHNSCGGHCFSKIHAFDSKNLAQGGVISLHSRYEEEFFLAKVNGEICYLLNSGRDQRDIHSIISITDDCLPPAEWG